MWQAAEKHVTSDYRDKPISASESTTTSRADTGRDFVVDAKVDQEILVGLDGYGVASESFYARTDGLNAPYFKRLKGSLPTVELRRGVAERLQKVNADLEPFGVELFVLDGFRPLALQQQIWDFFMRLAREKLGATADDGALANFAARYASDPRPFDPDKPASWPLHTTGAAVDLTLRNRATKETLFMGGIFDDPSTLSDVDHFERRNLVSWSAREAMRNRRLLYWSMAEVGFVNYQPEWWHYEFGGRNWAMAQKAANGPATLLYSPAGSEERRVGK